MIPKFMFSKIKAKFLFVRKKNLRTVCSMELYQVSCNNIFAGGILCAGELSFQCTAIGQVMSDFFYVRSSVEIKLIKAGQYTIQRMAYSISHLSVQCMKVQ